MKLRSSSSKTKSNAFSSDAFLRLFQAGTNLVIYRDILKEPVVSHFLSLLEQLGKEGNPGRGRSRKIAESYARFFSGLAHLGQEPQEEPVGTVWQNHLLNLILDAENPFSTSASHGLFPKEKNSLTEQAALDLRLLKTLHDVDGRQLLQYLHELPCDMEWESWEKLPQSLRGGQPGSLRGRFKQQLQQSADWAVEIKALYDFYGRTGVGKFGRFRAFHWKPGSDGGVIVPIPDPDPVRLEDLIGFEDQKQLLIHNTEFFLSGIPANNVFVYGDRGTGKSSAIKALLHHFPQQPLRMLEISRDDLADLPEVMHTLRGRPEYFIVFVDDLSFEEGETQYKTLKAVLEGSLEARPRNVVVYATSNRRHLIKENFSDRVLDNSGEVRPQDTLQEKVSLSDRFGIQLVFVAPDQDEYLRIVRSMAQRRQFSLADEELTRKALLWVQRHNTRSGRTARQFIDYLGGELGKPLP
ncbi:MAG: ATP-binding protein [Terriglobia bacterium]